jgi:hypothetical protein
MTSKVCVILADDAMERQKLRLLVEALGFETLEAASVKRAEPCLEASTSVVLVAQSPNSKEDLRPLLRDRLAPLRSPRGPKAIWFSQDISIGIPTGADMSRRLKDTTAKSLEEDFRQLGLLK